MIQEYSGFWDSIDPTASSPGDERPYIAAQITIPFEYLVSNGVQLGGEYLKVAPGAYDYSTQIPAGFAWINGRWYILIDDGTGGAAVRTLLHDVPLQYSRIDRVILRYDKAYTQDSRYIRAMVLKGEESASPAPPALVRSGDIYDLSLAHVLLKPGFPAILKTDIEDERFDSNLCGIAGFAPQPDLQPVIDDFLARLQELYGEANAEIAALIAQLKDNSVPADMVSTVAPGDHADWTTAQKYLDGLRTKSIPKTLTAAGWANKQQNITDAAILPLSPGSVRIAQNATDQQYHAFMGANLHVINQVAGRITVMARGGVPAIDIPVELEVRI